MWPTGHRQSVAHVCSAEFWIFQSRGSLASSREIEPEGVARENVFSQMLCAELASAVLGFHLWEEEKGYEA